MANLERRRRPVSPYDVEELRKELGPQCIDGVSVYIDNGNKDEIEEVLQYNPGRGRRALSSAMSGDYNDIYKREKSNNKTNNITAIIYSGKMNYRIYCQELTDLRGKKIIVMCVAYHKKVQKNKDNKTINIINAAAEYIFDFQISK